MDSIEDFLGLHTEGHTLLMSENQIDYTGRTCAKIGVSSRTLIKQSDRCSSHNHCLSNQILDLSDVARLSLVAPSMRLGGDSAHRTLSREGVAVSSTQVTIPASGTYRHIITLFIQKTI